MSPYGRFPNQDSGNSMCQACTNMFNVTGVHTTVDTISGPANTYKTNSCNKQSLLEKRHV